MWTVLGFDYLDSVYWVNHVEASSGDEAIAIQTDLLQGSVTDIILCAMPGKHEYSHFTWGNPIPEEAPDEPEET